MNYAESQYKALLKLFMDSSDLIDRLWKELSTKYSHNSRFYHNLTHVEQMLTELSEVKSKVTDINTIKMSIFYHDVIYKATKSDNEYQSAIFMQTHLKDTSFSSTEKCFQQIVATKTHELSNDNDTNILMDLDLAILGQDAMTYKNYTKNIRKEYIIYPAFMYNKGRAKALSHLLGDGNIFKTQYFQEKYEQKAKQNLLNEIEELKRK